MDIAVRNLDILKHAVLHSGSRNREGDTTRSYSKPYSRHWWEVHFVHECSTNDGTQTLPEEQELIWHVNYAGIWLFALEDYIKMSICGYAVIHYLWGAVWFKMLMPTSIY